MYAECSTSKVPYRATFVLMKRYISRQEVALVIRVTCNKRCTSQSHAMHGVRWHATSTTMVPRGRPWSESLFTDEKCYLPLKFTDNRYRYTRIVMEEAECITPQNDADSSKMVKRTCLTNAPDISTRRGRTWMRHEWRKWVWETNESQFDVHTLHWNCTKRCEDAGYQDAWRKNIKTDVSRLLFRIFNTLKKDASSWYPQ
jgi:hypothetical protein